MRIVFKNDDFGEIEEISIVIAINNRVLTRKMLKTDNCWIIDMNIPDGEHMYKYIINESIRFNDKDAYKYVRWKDGEVWSVLKVESGQIMQQNFRKPVITGYSMTPGVRYGQYNSNHLFNNTLDEKYSISIDVSEITGIHSITAIWYREDGSIYHIEEQVIDCPQENYIYTANTVFWINIPAILYDTGNNWTVEIYIDGALKIKDYFKNENKGDKRNVRFNSFIKNNAVWNQVNCRMWRG